MQPHLSSLRLDFRQGDVWAKANQARKGILPMRHSVLDTESPTSLEGFKLILPIINPFNYAIPGRSPEWQKKERKKEKASLRLDFRQGDVWAKANQARKGILPMRHSVLDTESPTSLENVKII